MKKLFLFLISLFWLLKLSAQKCLDISISTMMDKIETPVDAEASFKKCSTKKNDHNQVVIVNYGQDQIQLDTIDSRTGRNFSVASISTSPYANMQAPSQSQVDASKALAEQLKSMTPDQQKEWVKQMMAQNSSAGVKPIQDDGPTTQQVMHARDVAINQMRALNDEFSGKLHDIDDKCSSEIKTVLMGDKSKCPMDLEGMPSCDCANKIEAVRWKLIVDIQNKYDAQKTATYQIYFPKLKVMAGEVDNTVIKYKGGDDIKSPSLKGFLFSAQSSAFANSILVTTYCAEKIRKEGATAYVNKLNSENGVYDISCSHK